MYAVEYVIFSIVKQVITYTTFCVCRISQKSHISSSFYASKKFIDIFWHDVVNQLFNNVLFTARLH